MYMIYCISQSELSLLSCEINLIIIFDFNHYNVKDFDSQLLNKYGRAVLFKFQATCFNKAMKSIYNH